MIKAAEFITVDKVRVENLRQNLHAGDGSEPNTLAAPPTAHSQPARTLWVDYAKGWGIFLVVLGHVLRGLAEANLLPRNEAFRIVDQWIYAFHMPLFFFLSGLFIEQTAAKLSLGQFVTNKLQTIAYPYFVWSILQGSLKAATDRELSRVTDLWRIIYDPQMQFWFLYVLFLGSIAYGVLRRGGISRSGYFAFCMALYACHVLSVDFGNSGILYTTRINLIYFGLGVIVTRERCDRLLSLCSTVGLNLVAIAGFAALAAMGVSVNLAKISPLATPLLAAVGIAASLAFARRVESFSRLAFLHQWGLLSLQIYVAHTIASAAVRIFLQKGLKVSEPTVHIVLGTVVGIYAPIALAYACQKFDFPYLFSLRPTKKPQPRVATMVA